MTFFYLFGSYFVNLFFKSRKFLRKKSPKFTRKESKLSVYQSSNIKDMEHFLKLYFQISVKNKEILNLLATQSQIISEAEFPGFDVSGVSLCRIKISETHGHYKTSYQIADNSMHLNIKHSLLIHSFKTPSKKPPDKSTNIIHLSALNN